jgi:hypothetical protein
LNAGHLVGVLILFFHAGMICQPEKLSDFPWVLVRIDCMYCRRKGAYRLARLAAKYGGDIDLEHLLKLIAFDCAYIDRKPRKCIEAIRRRQICRRSSCDRAWLPAIRRSIRTRRSANSGNAEAPPAYSPF